MELQNGTPRKKVSRQAWLLIAAIVVLGLGLAAALVVSLHRYYYPLPETTHWSVSGPFAHGDNLTKWSLFLQDTHPLGARVEFFPKYKRMALEVRKEVRPACIYQEIWVEQDEEGRYKKVREEWTQDDCTRCCARTPLPEHPNLLMEVSPYFREWPPVIQDDLRPYFKVLDYEFR
jgi:hypothetical protein